MHSDNDITSIANTMEKLEGRISELETGVALNSLAQSKDLEAVKCKIESNDRLYNQKFISTTEATTVALDSADKAVNKAEVATEKRFEGVNEFRATLQDQQRTLMPRAELEVTISGLHDRIEKTENRLTRQEGLKSGISQGWGWVVGIIGLVIAIYTLIEAIVK